MSDKTLLAVNLIKQNESIQILPQPPILSSQKTGWERVGIFYYCHPAHFIPEHCLTHHVLAIAHNQFHLEVKKDGKYRNQVVDNGVIQLAPAYISQSLEWDREGKFSLITLCPHFVEQVAYESVHENSLEIIPQFSIIDPIIQHTAAALTAEIQTGCKTGSLFADSAATMLAVRLLQVYANCKPVIKSYKDGLSHNKLQAAIDYIEANLDQDLKLVDIAQIVGVSHYYFCHLFKQTFGITPHQYLIQQRIERAKILLKNNQLSIAEIAQICGFTDQSHLTRQFKRLVGITPKAMRS